MQLHVVDTATPGADTRHDALMRILLELDVAELRTVVALNKADAAEPEMLQREVERLSGLPVSAARETGLDALKAHLADVVAQVDTQRLEADQSRETTRSAERQAFGL